MSYKIAYIEFDTHAEIAHNFMNLMMNSDEFLVDYYFSEKILKNLNLQGRNSVFKSDFSSIFLHLSKGNYDLVIIGTVHRYFKTFYKITQHFNTSIVVHNLNFTKLSALDLFKNIFENNFYFRTKLLLKEGLMSAPKIWKRAKNLLVLDQNLASPKHHYFPLFYTKYFEKPQNENLIIVIPGAVSQQRRNYNKVFEFLRNNKLHNPLEIVFLGKTDERLLPILKSLENFSENRNFKIFFFENKVPQQEFDFWMNKADVLWCPIQKQTIFFGNTEIYGITKITGNIGDAIRYGKPAIFPSDYSSKLPFVVSEKEDLEAQFWEFRNWNYIFDEKFNKEKIQKDLEAILKTLL